MNCNKESRGIRNNNPLNIRQNPANNWQGLKKEQTDKEFCQFKAMKWGLRAAFLIMMNYRKNGLLTARQIIKRWAPPSENNTKGYINSVAMFLPVDVELRTYDDYFRLMDAMAWVETGRRLSKQVLDETMELIARELSSIAVDEISEKA